MAPRRILCTCDAAGCSQVENTDPVTGKRVKGCYLSSTTVHHHRETDGQVKLEKEHEVKTSVACPAKSPRKPSLESSLARPTVVDIPSNNIDISRRNLTRLQKNATSRCEVFRFPEALIFDSTIPSHPFQTAASEFQIKEYMLRPNDYNNATLLQFERWLNGTLRWANEIDCCHDAALIAIREEINELVVSNQQKIHTFVEQEWIMHLRKQSLKDSTAPSLYLDAEKFLLEHSSYSRMEPVIFRVALIGNILRTLCSLSRDRCSFILWMLGDLVDDTLSMADPNNEWLRHSTASAIPMDIRTAEKTFNLDPLYNAYVTCPTCRSLFKIDDSTKNLNVEESEAIDEDFPQDPSIPNICPYKESEEENICGTHLFEQLNTVTGKRRPRATFLMQDFPSWFARFISRPEIEEVISKPLEKIDRDIPKVYEDIWDGPVVRHLPGPDGLPFFRIYGSEIRVLFGLCFDGVNPFGNKSAGKQISVGAMYLKCFNLPDHMVDLQENLFCACIINGPDAPSLSEINHYLRPLIDHFVQFWTHGFYLNRTNLHAEGRLARGVIIPLIMDLHAIRQIIGTGSHNAKYFCTFCSLLIQNIDNYDPTTWPPPRSAQEHRELAEIWRSAPTKKIRSSLFKENSIRWTEFFRLPYFSHTTNTTIDPMHGFQNVFRSHIRQIWQVDHHNHSGDGLFVGKRPANKSKKKLSSTELERTLLAFRDDEKSVLDRAPKVVLYHLCEINSLRRARDRVQMREALKNFFDEYPSELHKNLKTVKAHPISDDLHVKFQVDVHEARQALIDTNMHSIHCREALDRYEKKVLQALCEEGKIDHPYRDSKPQLIGRLLDARFIFVEKPLPTELLPMGRAVLGRDMVKEINEDFNRTILPSWVSRGPKSFDSSKHGKLSAYEWRTTALIRLAISLPRLWGPRGGRHMEMLENYMHLLNAVIISSTRVVIPPTAPQESTASSFREEYGLYLQGRVELYPTGKVQPTEHLLYHIGDQLDKLGPLPKLSTNVFERYNGRLQDQPTNSRLGELEGTMFRGFCKAANLRSLMIDAERLGLPKALYSRFSKVFNIRGGSTLFDGSQELRFNSPNLDDLKNTKQGILDPDTLYLLERLQVGEKGHKHISSYSNISAWYLQKCRRNGITYTVADFHKQFINPDGQFNAHRDSNILVEDPHIRFGKPYSIHKIFALKSGSKEDKLDVYLVVRAYTDLTEYHLEHDHWRQFSLSGGRLYYDDLEVDARIIPLESVLGHFVKTPYESGTLPGIDTACIHVLPVPWHHAFENRTLDLEEEAYLNGVE